MGGDKSGQQLARISPAPELAVDVRVLAEEDDLIGLAETYRAGEKHQETRLPPGLSVFEIDDDDVVGRCLLQRVKDLLGVAVRDGLAGTPMFEAI